MRCLTSNIFFFLFFSSLFASDSDELLLQDIKRSEKSKKKICFNLPYLSNYTLQGGYFTMPSARMQRAGYAGAMFADISPYNIYSLSFQVFDRLELSGNYWVFRGVEDKNLGKDFGDSADRSGNIRFSLIHENDCFKYLPEIVIGGNDFFGSKRFCSYYLVGTKQFKKYLLELSLGYGIGRINGFFGGLSFSPFAKTNGFLKDLSIALEYDANDYKHHPQEHPDGRQVSYPVNFGLHYRLFNLFSFTVSSIRGEDVAYSVSMKYNIGQSNGFFGKRGDPLCYSSPIDREPVGIIRKDKLFAQELVFAFQKQCLDLSTVKVFKDTLWLKVINQRYRKEIEVRCRIESLLAALTPTNYKKVIVVIESEGVETQQYTYFTKDLVAWQEGKISDCILHTISQMEEVEKLCDPCFVQLLYTSRKKIWDFLLRPRLFTLFGSTKGKVKYNLSLIADLEGYLFDQIYYQILASYSISSSMQDLGRCDKLNPSQIINVRTDLLQYFQSNSLHFEKIYIQKAWNMGAGFYSRLALGYFEVAYAGGAIEALYYPVCSNFAIGVEAALLKKRNYSGMGFTNEIRKYKKYCPKEVPFPYALQYFIDLYYQNPRYLVDAKISIGQFLARDKGARFEAGRNFCNGVRLFFWYTLTNGNDMVNREVYFDKGIGFSIPLEFFSYKSSKKNLGYSMSAWLRDVGAVSETGNRLYPIIYSERNSF